MLDIIILILLLMGTLLGLKRGFILQFIRLTSFILSIAFASLFYKNVAPHLKWIPAPDFSAGQPAFSFSREIWRRPIIMRLHLSFCL